MLGAGAFGQVMLVKHEGKYLALKTLSKQQIMDMGLQVLCCTVLAPVIRSSRNLDCVHSAGHHPFALLD